MCYAFLNWKYEYHHFLVILHTYTYVNKYLMKEPHFNKAGTKPKDKKQSALLMHCFLSFIALDSFFIVFFIARSVFFQGEAPSLYKEIRMSHLSRRECS